MPAWEELLNKTKAAGSVHDATPPIADSACLGFKASRYAIPPLQPDGTRDMPADPGNRHDTAQTVRDVQEHNARFDAVCGRE